MSGMRRPVAVIIGMMGAGKTRVGKEVAQDDEADRSPIADNEIEHDAGMRIPEYLRKVVGNRNSGGWKATSCLICSRISTVSFPWVGERR